MPVFNKTILPRVVQAIKASIEWALQVLISKEKTQKFHLNLLGMLTRRETNLANLNYLPATDSSLHIQSQVTVLVYVKHLDVSPRVSRFLFCYPNRPSPLSYFLLPYRLLFKQICLHPCPLASVYTPFRLVFPSLSLFS